MLKSFATGLALTVLVALPAMAETTFTILGSGGGPIVNPERFQPANLLVVNGRNIVVDAGDGLSERLAAKRIRMGQIDDVLVSHLHFDHVAGLLGVLGLRFQTNPRKPVNIYGPPGTATLVEGLLMGMGPAMEASYGTEDGFRMTPDELVQVHEIRGGDTLKLGDVTVTALKNTHYSFRPGSALDQKYESLSFRFDTPDRSIVYSGDTGWSERLIELAKGVDLLVVELLDLPSIMVTIKQTVPKVMQGQVAKHLANHHLSPEQVGKLAAQAGVKKVVATHLVNGGRITPEITAGWAASIAENFDGEITIGDDLQDY